MNDELAQQLLSIFNIKARVVGILRVSGGRQHEMFKVSLNDNCIYVIKKFNSDCYLGRYNLEHFEATERLAEYVNQQLNCSVVALTHNNKSTISHNDITYVIYPWCDSVSLYNLNLSHCHLLGEMLYNLHHLPQFDFPVDLNAYKPFNTLLWSKLLKGILSQSELNALIDLSNQCFYLCTDSNHQKILSHCDINLDNILWINGQKPLLIDWESAGFIEPIIELLGVAFNAGGIATGKCNLILVRKVLNAYRLKSGENIELGEDLYIQSYATWFYWIDYCLSFANVLSKEEVQKEIKLSLNALKILEAHKPEINQF